MQWWCASSQGVAWSWAWRPYIGVWLFIILLAIAYLLYSRRAGSSDRRHILLFSAGLLSLWVALDWPLGPLGSGYLASVHMLRYLLISLIAPPLLLLGVPKQAYESLGNRPRALVFLGNTTQPLVAFFIFNVVISITHWPSLVDRLMVTQIGSFFLDIIWLAAGVVFWWPVVSPVPEWPRFTHVWKLAYLGLNGIIIRPVFFILLFSKFPAYAIYELAPPIGTASALSDQQFAAGIMKLGSAWVMLIAMGFVFFSWVRSSENTSSDRA
ncbi:MAG: hypothetical protein AMS21_02550 [Gemmatimonas sp. SG8_38_2]|nr:MAG: hypothetical protein AMS21_02550 [Gemmatimonas sp. SG8_38_2]